MGVDGQTLQPLYWILEPHEHICGVLIPVPLDSRRTYFEIRKNLLKIHRIVLRIELLYSTFMFIEVVSNQLSRCRIDVVSHFHRNIFFHFFFHYFVIILIFYTFLFVYPNIFTHTYEHTYKVEYIPTFHRNIQTIEMCTCFRALGFMYGKCLFGCHLRLAHNKCGTL